MLVHGCDVAMEKSKESELNTEWDKAKKEMKNVIEYKFKKKKFTKTFFSSFSKSMFCEKDWI